MTGQPSHGQPGHCQLGHFLPAKVGNRSALTGQTRNCDDLAYLPERIIVTALWSSLAPSRWFERVEADFCRQSHLISRR